MRSNQWLGMRHGKAMKQQQVAGCRRRAKDEATEERVLTVPSSKCISTSVPRPNSCGPRAVRCTQAISLSSQNCHIERRQPCRREPSHSTTQQSRNISQHRQAPLDLMYLPHFQIVLSRGRHVVLGSAGRSLPRSLTAYTASATSTRQTLVPCLVPPAISNRSSWRRPRKTWLRLLRPSAVGRRHNPRTSQPLEHLTWSQHARAWQRPSWCYRSCAPPPPRHPCLEFWSPARGFETRRRSRSGGGGSKSESESESKSNSKSQRVILTKVGKSWRHRRWQGASIEPRSL